MTRPAWYDVEMRGRRLEAISRRMNTQLQQMLEKKDYDMAFSFIDRFIKIEHALLPYIEQMTGVRALLKEGKKRGLESNIPA